MTRWRAAPDASTVAVTPKRKESTRMNRLRQVFAWLLVSVIVLSLVATLVAEEAS